MSEQSPPVTRGYPAPVPPHVPPHLVVDISKYGQPNDRLDPFSVAENVYREQPPLIYSAIAAPGLHNGTWIVTRYEDCREIYQNDAHYSTEGAAAFQTLVGETFRMIPLAVDPPEHGKYRILLNPWFSPKAITAMEPRMRKTITDLIDSFAHKGECDVAYDYGRLYPVRVFMDLMGFPPEKLENFLAWEYAILHSLGDIEKVKWGIGSAIAYLRSFIDEMKKNPAKNLTSHIVHGEIEGRTLTEEEIIGTVSFLWLGGLDTVAATTALMFRRLALDPQLQHTLRTDPDLIPDAVEEFLRFQPVASSIRLVKQDHQLHGVTIKKGDHIMPMNSAGNFDPVEFPDPRTFRLDRPSNRHFTLAGGPHRCLGSHLARRELRIALAEFLRRIPEFKVKPGSDTTAFPGLIAVPRLPLVWDGAAAT